MSLLCLCFFVFFFKQKTAYEMRISDWSSDVCSSDLAYDAKYGIRDYRGGGRSSARETAARVAAGAVARLVIPEVQIHAWVAEIGGDAIDPANFDLEEIDRNPFFCPRSEEHTSELQSLMRISYAVFCLKKKKQHKLTL